jgi:hypothetical protein
MRLHVLAFMFVSLPLAGVLAIAQSAAPRRAAAAGMELDTMDRTGKRWEWGPSAVKNVGPREP